jgi:hypothetical protein
MIPYENVWFHPRYSDEFHSFLGLIALANPLFTIPEKERKHTRSIGMLLNVAHQNLA